MDAIYGIVSHNPGRHTNADYKGHGAGIQLPWPRTKKKIGTASLAVTINLMSKISCNPLPLHLCAAQSQ